MDLREDPQASKIDALQDRCKRLEKLNKMLADQLQGHNEASAVPKAMPSIRVPESGGYIRISLGDTHGNLLDQAAVAAFLADLEVLSPSVREIVLGGDMMECGGWLAAHHTLGYVKQTAQSFRQDVATTNWLLDRITEIAELAHIDYLEGNHERRLEQWVLTSTANHPEDAEMLRQIVCPESVLSLPDRNIEFHRIGEQHDNLPINGTLKRGRMYFTHGFTTCKHAADQTLQKMGGNTTYFHTHRRDAAHKKTVEAGTIGAWCPGCLCKLVPLWRHNAPNDWVHGYGLDLVRDNGDFLHINVPIIDGKSYMNPLLQQGFKEQGST